MSHEYLSGCEYKQIRDGASFLPFLLQESQAGLLTTDILFPGMSITTTVTELSRGATDPGEIWQHCGVTGAQDPQLMGLGLGS